MLQIELNFKNLLFDNKWLDKPKGTISESTKIEYPGTEGLEPVQYLPAHVFSANFAESCVKNSCHTSVCLRIYSLASAKLCSKIRTHRDFKQALRIMHLTLPRGAVSYEQRNGRIDRYRSLLVRRRAAEFVENMQIDNSSNLIARAFAYLEQDKHPTNNLYPNWSIHNPKSKWHFEELMPVWEFTEESCFADSIIEMYQSYHNSLGVNESSDSSHIDLSTISQNS